MVRLVFKEPRYIDLQISESKYPHELRLNLLVDYKEAIFEEGSHSRESTQDKLTNEFCAIYVLYSEGYFTFENPTRNVSINIASELRDFRIPLMKPLRIIVDSKPLSRNEIHEIDEKLAPDDLKITWSIDAYGFIEKSYIKQQDINGLTLIPIYIGTDKAYEMSRKKFVENILEKADMLKREFLEVIVEPIDLSYVKETRLKEALELLLEKQKILLGAISKQKEARTATDWRGIIDEVRKTVEGLDKIEELCKEIYKTLRIEAPDLKAKDEASREMSEALSKMLSATYNYASRFGIHTTTMPQSGKLPYTPVPTKIEAEFAIQQAIIELNYLIRLLKTYALRI
jgi:hypothetical protein